MSKAIEAGKKAPQFTLPDQDGEKVALKNLTGGWVVLYFYPKDDTPGCTTEGVEFTARKAAFEEAGATILGVSPDSTASHRKFCDKHSLGVTLLADEKRTVLQKYGAWGIKKLYGRESEGVIRTTVLIDPTGKIAHVWSNVRVKGHVDRVYKRLMELAD